MFEQIRAIETKVLARAVSGCPSECCFWSGHSAKRRGWPMHCPVLQNRLSNFNLYLKGFGWKYMYAESWVLQLLKSWLAIVKETAVRWTINFSLDVVCYSENHGMQFPCLFYLSDYWCSMRCEVNTEIYCFCLTLEQVVVCSVESACYWPQPAHHCCGPAIAGTDCPAKWLYMANINGPNGLTQLIPCWCV